MLCWVCDNIVCFGGDLVYIIIVGEFVGLILVSVLMVLLLSKLLIVGVIGESGVLIVLIVL